MYHNSSVVGREQLAGIGPRLPPRGFQVWTLLVRLGSKHLHLLRCLDDSRQGRSPQQPGQWELAFQKDRRPVSRPCFLLPLTPASSGVPSNAWRCWQRRSQLLTQHMPGPCPPSPSWLPCRKRKGDLEPNEKNNKTAEREETAVGVLEKFPGRNSQPSRAS